MALQSGKVVGREKPPLTGARSSMQRFSLKLSVFLSLATALPAGAAELGDWNSWRGSGRDGVVVETQLPETLNGVLKPAWEKPHSPSYSGPIIHSGMLYTTETVDKQFEQVIAYNLETGEKAWETKWEGSMSVPFFAAANGSWIRATPACTDDGLVVVGMRDVMVCLDPKTGTEKWKVDFNKDFGAPLPMFGASCSPLIDNDSVYMQSGGATVCLSMADGSLKWETLQNGDSKTPGAFSSPTITTISGVRQLLVQTREAMCGVTLETGEVLWSEPINSFRGMNILTALPIGDRVFSSAHSGTAQLFQISQTDGKWSVEEVWSRKQQAYMSSPVLVNGKIFIHLRNERMAMLDPESGDAIYTTKPVGKYASLVTDGTRVLALTNRGELLLIDGTSEKFNQLDKMKVADNAWAHLAIAGDYVVVRDLKALKVYRMASSQ